MFCNSVRLFDALAKQREATIRFIMSVRPSVDNVEKYGIARQPTDDNVIRHALCMPDN